MGIHGEPGIWRGKIKTADEVSAEMLDRILADRPLESGDRISVLVNSLGATPHEELFIIIPVPDQPVSTRWVSASVMPLVGRYATIHGDDQAPPSLSSKLDDELEELLKAPAHCAFWNVCMGWVGG